MKKWYGWRSWWMAGLLAAGLLSTTVSQAAMPKYTGQLLPKPQQVMGDWQLLDLAGGVAVETADAPGGAVELAVELLNERAKATVGEAKGEPIRVILGRFEDQLIQEASQRHGLGLKDLVLPAEGYAVRVVEEGGKPVVIAAGTDDRGAFYAAATLIQQMGQEEGQPVLKIADLEDYPQWQHRYFGDYMIPTAEQLEFLALYKINGYTIQHRYEWREFAPENKPVYSREATFRKALENIHAFELRADLVDVMLQIHIYAASPRKHPIFDVTREEDIQGLIDRIRFAAGYGINHVMVLVDDWTPLEEGAYVSPNASERERFGDNAGKAHAYLMQRVHEAIVKDHPNLGLSFCPATYSTSHVERFNTPRQMKYLRDLAAGLPESVRIVWTGPLVSSTQLGREDYLTFSRYVSAHPLMLWDNAYAVEGQDNYVPQFIVRYYPGMEVDHSGFIYMNNFTLSKPWPQLMALSSNDYLWNPEAFDTQASHRTATEKVYGQGVYPVVERYLQAKRHAEALENGSPEGKDAVDALRQAIEGMERAALPTHRQKEHFNRQKARLLTNLPATTVPRLTQAPAIDGKLDDPAWEQASVIDGFTHLSGDGRKVDPTVGRIGYDDQALYLAFRATHAKPLDEPVGMERDGPVYAGSDAVEVFLRTDRGSRSYVHLVFDHAGNRFDQVDDKLAEDWNPKWQVVTAREDGVWVAEVRIPFESLMPPFDGKPASGDVWTGNFCRNNATGSQVSAWSSPYGTSFHNTQFFGELKFE